MQTDKPLQIICRFCDRPNSIIRSWAVAELKAAKQFDIQDIITLMSKLQIPCNLILGSEAFRIFCVDTKVHKAFDVKDSKPNAIGSIFGLPVYIDSPKHAIERTVPSRGLFVVAQNGTTGSGILLTDDVPTDFPSEG